jgi:Uncharacterized protein conserved in bacteria (DUF2188)
LAISSTAENLPLNNAIQRACGASQSSEKGKSNMSHVIYQIVEHDGGWAYKVGDVFSETFPSRELAQKAANRAAREQRAPGSDEAIEFEDSDGKWHDEDAKGIDRPDTDVKG